MFIAYCDEAHRWFTNRNITPFGPTVEREKETAVDDVDATATTDTTTIADTIEDNVHATAHSNEPSPLMPPALLSDLAVKGHCMTQV